eukprot:g2963.t1
MGSKCSKSCAASAELKRWVSVADGAGGPFQPWLYGVCPAFLATPAFDARLCRAAKSAILRMNEETDPATVFPATATAQLNADQAAELAQLVWESMPEFGRFSERRWKLVFDNFDWEKTGMISLESWCEIIRQYTLQKISVWPDTFTAANVQHADCSKMLMQEAGGAAAATSRGDGAEITRGGRGGGAGGHAGAIMEQATGGGQPTESVHLSQHVIVPTFLGRAQVKQDYTFMEGLPKGAFGKAKVMATTVKHRRTGVMRSCISIKLTDKHKDQARLVELVTEFEFLKQLDHPNISRLYEVYEEEDMMTRTHVIRWNIHFITDYGRSLGDRLARLNTPMSEWQCASYIQQCLRALSYCHGMGIIHRDVKPESVLCVTGRADSAVKLTDFTTSDFLVNIEAHAKTVTINKEKEVPVGRIRRSVGIANPRRSDTLIRKVMPKAGTAKYMPPEMHHTACWYGLKADVFSCGVMLHEMLTAFHPFHVSEVDNAHSAARKIVEDQVDYFATYWCWRSPLAMDLVEQMLEQDPGDRVDTREALQHHLLVQCQTHHKLRQAVPRLLAKTADADLPDADRGSPRGPAGRELRIAEADVDETMMANLLERFLATGGSKL